MASKPLQRPVSPASDAAAPDFVVVDVETACSRVSSICQIGIVGFKDGVEIFEYETLVDPLDRFSYFNTRIQGITCDHVAGAPNFGDIHETIDGHLAGRITVAHSFFDKERSVLHVRSMVEPSSRRPGSTACGQQSALGPNSLATGSTC